MSDKTLYFLITFLIFGIVRKIRLSYTLKVLNIVYTFEEMVKVFLPYDLT